MVNNLEEDFIKRAAEIRKEILNLEGDVLVFKHDVSVGDIVLQEVVGDNISDKGEILANITLAYRYLENARMRIGKAIQAYDGGTSMYKN